MLKSKLGKDATDSGITGHLVSENETQVYASANSVITSKDLDKVKTGQTDKKQSVQHLQQKIYV